MRLSPYRVAVTSACLLLVAAFAGCGQPPASAPAGRQHPLRQPRPPQITGRTRPAVDPRWSLPRLPHAEEDRA